MSKDTTITVGEWPEIRNLVALKLKSEGSQQSADTREKIAEALLISGYIDIEYVRKETLDNKHELAEQLQAVRDAKKEANLALKKRLEGMQEVKNNG